MNDLEDRIKELEIRYTHQSAVIDALSDLIRDQQEGMDALRRSLDQLKSSLPNAERPPHEAPPHY